MVYFAGDASRDRMILKAKVNVDLIYETCMEGVMEEDVQVIWNCYLLLDLMYKPMAIYQITWESLGPERHKMVSMCHDVFEYFFKGK